MTPYSKNYRLTVAWQTPIGLMQGLLAEEGWLSLDFPPPESQQTMLRHPVQVLCQQIGWPEADSRFVPDAHLLYGVDAMTKFLSDYFQGRSPTEYPPVGQIPATAFTHAVWKATQRIPYGQTTTYGELARSVGRPGAARAVGQAMAKNSLPLIIPCHRVVGSGANGRSILGGFSGGLTLKSYLLELENEASHARSLAHPAPKKTRRRHFHTSALSEG